MEMTEERYFPLQTFTYRLFKHRLRRKMRLEKEVLTYRHFWGMLGECKKDDLCKRVYFEHTIVNPRIIRFYYYYYFYEL